MFDRILIGLGIALGVFAVLFLVYLAWLILEDVLAADND